MVKIRRLPGAVQITLTPNRSLSWQQSKLIMGIFAAFCLSIAFVWSFFGAWLILPFAGIEVGLLLFVTYLVSKATYQKQVLLINREHVSLIKGRSRHPEKFLWDLSDLQFLTYETTHPEDVMKLLLKGQNTATRLGEFLNLEDQKYLVHLLERQDIRLKTINNPVTIEC